MSIRSILVPLDGGADNAQTLKAALAIARGFQAHVDALHVRADSRDIAPMFGEGMSGAMVEEMIAVAEKAAEERAQHAEALFRAQVKDSDLAHWIIKDGREDEAVAWRGRLADLTVMQRAGEEGPVLREQTLHAVLFESGRPVLVLPPSYTSAPLGEVIAVAWNGTAQAARAVQGALPFITRAKAVHVMTCESTRTEVTAADELADYLKRWGVSSQVHAFPPKGGNVGAAVLETAKALEADLVVSGGYSHPRLLQAVLGGVTSVLLDEADVPVLFSH